MWLGTRGHMTGNRRTITKKKKLDFAEYLCQGYAKIDAVRMCGYAGTNQSLSTIAYRLSKDSIVEAKVAEHFENTAKLGDLTLDDKLRVLASIILTSKNDTTKMRAIELDSKIRGHFAPDRVDIAVSRAEDNATNYIRVLRLAKEDHDTSIKLLK